jgi:hypothetical protein
MVCPELLLVTVFTFLLYLGETFDDQPIVIDEDSDNDVTFITPSSTAKTTKTAKKIDPGVGLVYLSDSVKEGLMGRSSGNSNEALCELRKQMEEMNKSNQEMAKSNQAMNQTNQTVSIEILKTLQAINDKLL